MKSISPALAALLATGGPFVMADLYTVTLTGGTVLRWADFDVDVGHPVNGYTYSSAGPVLKRGKTRVVIGVEVDTLDLSIFARSTDIVNGTPLLAAAQAGAFDGATLIIERAFLSPAPVAVGVVSLFSGRFGDVQLSRTEMQCRINSGTEALGVKLPRNIFQPGCIHVLYDSGCGLSRATWGVSGTVSAGATSSTVPCSLTQAAGWFSQGYVTFSGGALDGVKRTIKSHSAGVLSLFMPLPSGPVAGQAFTAFAGCDKSQSTCSGKFSNIANFRGCPYIPVPDIAI